MPPDANSPASAVGRGSSGVSWLPRPREAADLPAAYVDEPLPWVLVMRVRGGLDSSGAARLQRILDDRLMAPPVHLIVDLSDVTTLGSAGIDLLVRTQRSLHTDHVRFSVVGTEEPTVHGPLVRSGVLPLLDTVDSVTSALASSDPPPSKDL